MERRTKSKAEGLKTEERLGKGVPEERLLKEKSARLEDFICLRRSSNYRFASGKGEDAYSAAIGLDKTEVRNGFSFDQDRFQVCRHLTGPGKGQVMAFIRVNVKLAIGSLNSDKGWREKGLCA